MNWRDWQRHDAARAGSDWPKAATRYSQCGQYAVCCTQEEGGHREFAPFVRQDVSGIEAMTIAALEAVGGTPGRELQMMRDGWAPLHGSTPWPRATWGEAVAACEAHAERVGPKQEALL